VSDFDPYLELGIGRDATPEEIRAAFRKAARQRHPDTAGDAPSDVRRAIEAYHLLGDPATRAAYDAGHGETAPAVCRREGTRPARRAICTACLGTGMVDAPAECPACRGSGGITDLSGPRARVLPCRTCLGRGRTTSPRRCDACAGTGSVSRDSPSSL